MELNLFDRKKVEKILDRYPQLEVVLSSGMVSKKLCRELLDIDKWLMDDLYKDLLLAGAIKGTSSSSFKAKDDTLALIRERRAQANNA
jgi:hypothetical protein